MNADRESEGLFRSLMIAPLVGSILVLLVGSILVLLLPVVILIVIGYFLYGLILQFVIWFSWCSRNITVLMVTSDSPNWQEYIETDLLPQLPKSTVVLNWSERRTWKTLSLSVLAFRYFGGQSEFNPLIVVFRPFRWARTFRLWQAFKDYKHGKTKTLELLEGRIFKELAISRPVVRHE